MPKRVMIATGGTGGHIYPAVALAQQIAAKWGDAEILFVGGGLERNRYFDRESFDWREVPCGTFFGMSPLALCKSCFRIAAGVSQSCRIIKAFEPDVVVGFGSYYSFPPLIAAKLMSVPYLLHEANSIPGKVNKLLSRWASATGVHFPMTSSLLKGKSAEVGMPLRNGYRRGEVTQDEARRRYGLAEDKLTLLVFGGSQGARVINDHIIDALGLMNRRSDFQIIHIAGDDAGAEQLRKSYGRLSVSACVKTYEERMDLAWQAADCVICRSGAGAIAELLEFEVPAILVPFAKAADDHQNHNADFIVDTVKGGVKIVESELSGGRICEELTRLIAANSEKLKTMRLSMAEYKRKARKQDMLSLVDHNALKHRRYDF